MKHDQTSRNLDKAFKLNLVKQLQTPIKLSPKVIAKQVALIDFKPNRLQLH